MNAPVHTALDVTIRPAESAELRFVQATWTKSMRATSPERWVQRYNADVKRHSDRGPMPARVWRAYKSPAGSMLTLGIDDDGVALHPRLWIEAHSRLVDHLLESSVVYVATLPDVPSEIVGWVVAADDVAHFCYVIPAARRCGVARRLLSPLGCSSASHMTPDGRHLLGYLRGVVE